MPTSAPDEARIAEILRRLGVPENYGKDRQLPLFPEAADLVPVGLDVHGREQRLAPAAAHAWRAMQKAAAHDRISLLLVSAFRSVERQREIVEGKLKAGTPLESILRVNAAPGYSEHHTGRAIDLTTPGCPPLSAEFETTAAFVWLAAQAKDFGFALTYPRGNPHGMVHEPWHWALVETGARR